MEEREFESVFIETVHKNKTTIIGEVLTKKLQSEKKNVMLGTGQNFDYIIANSHKHTSELLNIFISSGLIPNITSPTRTTHSSAKLIDIIYTFIIYLKNLPILYH